MSVDGKCLALPAVLVVVCGRVGRARVGQDMDGEMRENFEGVGEFCFLMTISCIRVMDGLIGGLMHSHRPFLYRVGGLEWPRFGEFLNRTPPCGLAALDEHRALLTKVQRRGKSVLSVSNLERTCRTKLRKPR